MATLSGTPTQDLPEFERPPADPLPALWRWLEEAPGRGISEPHAAVLSTVDPSGMPRGRVLHVKDWDERGLIFTSSTGSDKGRDLAADPRASLVFFWRETIQQIQVSGRVAPLEGDESDLLFAARPRVAQAASHASAQSRALGDEGELRARAEAHLTGEEPLPRPEEWTGYRLVPSSVEFWCGSPDRLHRRLRYTRAAEGEKWSATRLQP